MRGVDWYFSFGVAISKLVNKRLYILSTKNNNESRRNYLYHTLCMMSNQSQMGYLKMRQKIHARKRKQIDYPVVYKDGNGKYIINPVRDNPKKWSDTIKQSVGNLPTNCLNVFDHFVWLVLKRLAHVRPLFLFYILLKNIRKTLMEPHQEFSDVFRGSGKRTLARNVLSTK